MKNIAFLSILLVLFSACEKDIELDLKELPPTLTIEAKLSNQSSKSLVKISMSKGLSGNQAFEYPHITDAQVTITDSQGNQIVLSPDAHGVYKSIYAAGLQGKIYKLDVGRGDKHATAEATMPEPVQIIDFKRVFVNGESFLDVYFDDNPNQDDYYKIQLTTTEQNGSSYNSREILTDDFNYDTNQHKLRLSMEVYDSGVPNTTYTLRLCHINELMYHYFKTLRDIQGAGYGTTPFTTSVPGNPNTNVEGGIGYFSAESVWELSKNSLD